MYLLAYVHRIWIDILDDLDTSWYLFPTNMSIHMFFPGNFSRLQLWTAALFWDRHHRESCRFQNGKLTQFDVPKCDDLRLVSYGFINVWLGFCYGRPKANCEGLKTLACQKSRITIENRKGILVNIELSSAWNWTFRFFCLKLSSSFTSGISTRSSSTVFVPICA